MAGAAITATFLRASGYMIAHSSDCIAPIEPPMTANQVLMPRTFESSCWAFTWSRMVRYGKSAPNSRPLVSSELGPVEPWQLPSMFGATTKYLSVSIAKPGPMMSLHQPSVGWALLAEPVACESPVRACKTKTALVCSWLSSPHDSNAIRAEANVRPLSSFRLLIGANCRSPAKSPSRQAPVAGGLPIS